jgi:hypothetical protein
MWTRRRFLAAGAAVAAAAAAGCSSNDERSSGSTGDGADDEEDFSARFAQFEPADEPDGDLSKVVWPAFVLAAGADVARLYRFQVTNGAVMRYMPCFCGCGRNDGHRNNRDCYIRRVNADRSVEFDSMAPT